MDIFNNPIFTKEIDGLRMDISEICSVSLPEGFSYGDLRPSFTRIYAVLKGEGVITRKGKEIPMTAGNIYILPTGLRFSYKCHTDIEKIYFHVNLLQYNNTDMMRKMNDFAVLPNTLEECLQAQYLLSRNDMYSVMRLKAWLWDVVAQGLEISGTDFSSIQKYSDLVQQVIVYVDDNLRSALTVKDIASALYISEGKLQKVFRQEMKQPLGKYISDRLYFKAEQLIRLTNRSIGDISNELGFCDPFYFTRCFTQRYGYPPSVYRKNLK
ncbi:MAG: helix-turn-helix transcriptional regulator [Clostridia bacterium]|nr:helix-turn-helix transcriptional regulator [Clostridia bacterium]